MSMAFLSPSPMELMVIAVLALIVLGPSRLPEVARSVGKGVREMKDSLQGVRDEGDDDDGSDRHDPEDDPDEPEGGDDDASFGQPEDEASAGHETPRSEQRERVGA